MRRGVWKCYPNGMRGDATISEYFRLERPDEAEELPVLVSVPHAGEWIPPVVAREMTIGSRPPKRDLDLFTDRMWQGAPARGATLVQAKVSRYVLDLNRAPDDVTAAAVLGAVTVEQPGYYRERGVVWRTTTDGTPVMARPMTEAAFTRRLDLFWRPYHDALAAEIARLRAAYGYCILLDGHSMPSLGRRHIRTPDRRADIVPGDLDGASCDPRLMEAVVEHFRAAGYSVAPNEPYKGGFITRNYGAPLQGVHAIQIEVNRDLYMDEHTFRVRADGLAALAEACVGLIGVVGALDLGVL